MIGYQYKIKQNIINLKIKVHVVINIQLNFYV